MTRHFLVGYHLRSILFSYDRGSFLCMNEGMFFEPIHFLFERNIQKLRLKQHALREASILTKWPLIPHARLTPRHTSNLEHGFWIAFTALHGSVKLPWATPHTREIKMKRILTPRLLSVEQHHHLSENSTTKHTRHHGENQRGKQIHDRSEVLLRVLRLGAAESQVLEPGMASGQLLHGLIAPK